MATLWVHLAKKPKSRQSMQHCNINKDVKITQCSPFCLQACSPLLCLGHLHFEQFNMFFVLLKWLFRSRPPLPLSSGSPRRRKSLHHHHELNWAVASEKLFSCAERDAFLIWNGCCSNRKEERGCGTWHNVFGHNGKWYNGIRWNLEIRKQV